MKFLSTKAIDDIIFFDIETAGMVENYSDLPEKGKEFCSRIIHELNNTEEKYRAICGLYTPINKIVCVSVYCKGSSLQSFYGSEADIIKEFNDYIYAYQKRYLCAHGAFGFDAPMLCQKCVIHGIEIPLMYDVMGMKPWNVKSIIDTLDIWKGTGWGRGNRLDDICFALGIKSPKSEMDGSKVHSAFYNGKIEQIVAYCEADVTALFRVLEIFMGKNKKNVQENTLFSGFA